MIEIMEKETISVNDTAYWDRYYKTGACSAEPSPFARYVAERLESGRKLVELGCGNGRDAIFFAQMGQKVTAIDLSNQAIAALQARRIANVRFILGSFVENEVHQPEAYDYAYSRFTLHAIDQNQASLLFENVYRGLRPGGKFFIEVRSVHDPICGLGEPAGPNAWIYNDHYRRFIVLDELTKELAEHGFMVEYAEENNGFAPYGNDDPPVIRVIAGKTG